MGASVLAGPSVADAAYVMGLFMLLTNRLKLGTINTLCSQISRL